MSQVLLASFRCDADLQEAARRARRATCGSVETYSPCPSEEGSDASPLPLVILIAGVIGAVGGFLMEGYADAMSYPLDIGGRPNVSWPAFVPIAFEIGVLAAVAAGFFGYLIINRLPRPYEPIDEALLMRESSRARWLLVIRPMDEAGMMEARSLVRALDVAGYEELVA